MVPVFFQNSLLTAFGHLLMGPITSIIFHHNVEISLLLFILFCLNRLMAKRHELAAGMSMNEVRAASAADHRRW